MVFYNLRQIEKKSTLRIAAKAVRFSQRVLFRHTRNAEWLAREPGYQYIVLGYTRQTMLVLGVFSYVARYLVVAHIVGLIGKAAVFVPLAGKDTLATNSIKRFPETAYACKKIYKCKGMCCGYRAHGIALARHIFQCPGHKVVGGRGVGRLLAPPVDGALTDAKFFAHFCRR